jgi:hypothetical protein
MPDDPWFEDMNPVLRMWLYESWNQDFVEKNDFAKNYSILVGSFYNPDMARKMLDDPGDTRSIKSTEDDFLKSLQIVKKEMKKDEQKSPHRRKRRRQIISEG